MGKWWLCLTGLVRPISLDGLGSVHVAWNRWMKHKFTSLAWLAVDLVCVSCLFVILSLFFPLGRMKIAFYSNFQSSKMPLFQITSSNTFSRKNLHNTYTFLTFPSEQHCRRRPNRRKTTPHKAKGQPFHSKAPRNFDTDVIRFVYQRRCRPCLCCVKAFCAVSNTGTTTKMGWVGGGPSSSSFVDCLFFLCAECCVIFLTRSPLPCWKRDIWQLMNFFLFLFCPA